MFCNHVAPERINSIFNRETEPNIGLGQIQGQATFSFRQHDAIIILSGTKPLFRRGSIQSGCTCFIDRRPPPLFKHESQIISRAWIPLIGRETIPPLSFFIILRNSPSRFVSQAEIILSFDDSVVSRLAKPQYRFKIVLGHTRTGRIHVAHIELGGRKPLLRRLEIVTKGLANILWQAAAKLVHHPQIETRWRI